MGRKLFDPDNYRQGGARDPRVRALLGTHVVEQGVQTIHNRLRGVWKVGRTLILRYHARDDRFEWRYRPSGKGGRNIAPWVVVGARVPGSIRVTLWQGTQAKVDAVERWMAMRRDGRGPLFLVRWLAEHGAAYRTSMVELVWEAEERGRVAWKFRLDGRTQTIPTWRCQEPLALYGKDAEELIAATDMDAGFGPITCLVDEAMISKLDAMDRRLEMIGRGLKEDRAPIRVYRHMRFDTWQIRKIGWPLEATHIAESEVESVLPGLIPRQRALVAEALTVLEERRILRRLVKVVAVLMEGAMRWPGGTWRIRGYEEGEKTAVWRAVWGGKGKGFFRAYTKAQKGKMNGLEDIEESENGIWED